MSADPINTTTPIYACNMNAIAPDEREQHAQTGIRLFKTVTEIRPLDNGYAFRLALDTATLMDAAKFISNERLCCGFFGFRLDIAPSGDALWLSLYGGENIKAFIAAELGEFLPAAITFEA